VTSSPVWSHLGPKPRSFLRSVAQLCVDESGAPTLLFQTRVRGPILSEELFTYDVSPDGQHFLINVNLEQNNPAPVHFVLN